jgi:hypothetical protein
MVTDGAEIREDGAIAWIDRIQMNLEVGLEEDPAQSV